MVFIATLRPTRHFPLLWKNSRISLDFSVVIFLFSTTASTVRHLSFLPALEAVLSLSKALSTCLRHFRHLLSISYMLYWYAGIDVFPYHWTQALRLPVILAKPGTAFQALLFHKKSVILLVSSSGVRLMGGVVSEEPAPQRGMEG